MADTRIQLEVEDWVRAEWMSIEYGQTFYRERVKLTSGGVFDFDAVSVDRHIVATISTSGARTASGKYAVGKMLKIRSDMYFLLLTEAERLIVVLTEKDMYEQCLKEKAGGRVPEIIEFGLAEIPSEMRLRLDNARKKASKEVQPSRNQTLDEVDSQGRRL